MMDAVKSLKLDLYLLMFVSAEFHRDTPPIVQGPGSIPSQRGSRLSLRVHLLYILQGKIYVIKNSSGWLRKKDVMVKRLPVALKLYLLICFHN